MKEATAFRLGQCGARIMHDERQQEFLTISFGKVESFVGMLELDALYRFHEAGATARVQALRLTSNRECFMLREYVDFRLFAECRSLDEVNEALERRKADQSERVVRLRALASGGPLVDVKGWPAYRR